MLIQSSTISAQTLFLMIFNPILLIIMFTLGILKIRHARRTNGNPFNIILSMYFFSIVLGVSINVVYAFLQGKISDALYLFLAKTSAYFIIISCIFPNFFIYGIWKGFITITKSQKQKYFIIWMILYAYVFVSPTIELITPEYIVHYGLDVSIWIIILNTGQLLMFFMISRNILRDFSDQKLKKKFKAFMFGYMLQIFVIYNSVSMLAGWISREVAALIITPVALIASLLIYYGIGKKV